MAEVWVAQQSEPVQRQVTLKLLEAGLNSKAVQAAFEQERQMLALLDHPQIARLLDSGLTEDRRPFFVTELVNGPPLTTFCDEARLTPQARLELFVPICQAVQHAHQKGLVHGNLEPANIRVTLVDGRAIPKVVGFGLARARDGKLTEEALSTSFDTFVATLEYLAPEQAGTAGRKLDARAEVNALSVNLYELLTGLRPLDGKRLKQAAFREMIRLLEEEDPALPSTRLATAESLASTAALRQLEPRELLALVRGDLDQVIMKCLQKSRQRRYDTPNGLANDLQRYLAAESVAARPRSASRLGRFFKRHKGAVVAASLVLLALVAGAVGTTIGLVRAEKARFAEAERAEGERQAKEEAEARRAEAEAQRARAEVGEKLASERLAQVEAEKRKAEQEKQKAEEEKRKAQAVSDFLQQKLLGQANPELLDRAARELNKDMQPLVQAEMLKTLGDAYLAVSQYSRAIALLERSDALRKQHLGADHPDTLGTLSSLALAYLVAGKVAEATALFEQVRPAQEKTLGADHPSTLTTLRHLAEAYRTVGRFAEALAILEQVRDVQVKKQGPEHPDTLRTLTGLAEVYLAVGRFAEAIALLQRIRDVQMKRLGADHPDTLTTLANLARAYQAVGKLPQTIALLERVRVVQVEKLGADHPSTLTTQFNLALAYASAQQLDKAVALFEDVLQRQQAKLGRQHPHTLETVANLGVVYKDAGRLKQAIPLLEEVYRASRQVPTLRRFAPQLLDGEVKAGLSAEAVKLGQDILAEARKTRPQESAQLADILTWTSEALLQQKAGAEAEPLLRECLTLRTKIQPDSWITFHTKSLLGAALLAQKKVAEAEPLLLAGYEGMKQREGRTSPEGKVCLRQAVERLVQLYEATGRKDEAAKWQKIQEETKVLPMKPAMP